MNRYVLEADARYDRMAARFERMAPEPVPALPEPLHVDELGEPPRDDWHDWSVSEPVIVGSVCEVQPLTGPPTLPEIGEPPRDAWDELAATWPRLGERSPADPEVERIIRVIPVNDVLTAPTDPIAWTLDGLIPRGVVTLLGAHGGAGKSVLALAWALHAAAGREWNGCFVPVQRVVFASFEDGPEIVRARVRRIMEASELPPSALRQVMLLDATDSEPLMVERSLDGRTFADATRTFDELRELAHWAEDGLLVIDNASDAFGGNENNRQQVRTFMRALARLARDYRCAVLLLLHIAKHEARSGGRGESYSGSTAWHNSARSRLALVQDGFGVQLRHEKCNVARCAQPIALRWIDAGILVPAIAGCAAERDELERDAEAVVAAMRAALMSGVTIGAARSGPGAATATLKTYPEELGHDLMRDSARLWRALNRLEASGRIVRATIRTGDRKEREIFRLVRTGAELAREVAA